MLICLGMLVLCIFYLLSSLHVSGLTEIDTCVLPYYCSEQNPYCNETLDREWLVDLYTSTNGQNWFNNTDWISNKSHCEWYGVHCCSIFNMTMAHVNWTNSQNSSQLQSIVSKQTCINRLILSDNNLIGALPNYWPNSSVFTVISFDDNQLNSTIPPYSKLLSNLGLIEIRKNNLTGTLPDFPISNCLSMFSATTNYFVGTIPDWSNQIWMAYVELSANYLNGTIPDWSNWLHPGYVELGNLDSVYYSGTRRNQFSGTIPNWSNWGKHSITLNSIKLSGLG